MVLGLSFPRSAAGAGRQMLAVGPLRPVLRRCHRERVHSDRAAQRLEFYLARQEFPPLDTIKEHILTHSGQAAKKVNQYGGKDLEASFKGRKRISSDGVQRRLDHQPRLICI